MFQAEYSSGQPLRMLVDLRASVDGALSLAAGSAAKTAPRAAAAAAAAGGSVRTAKAAEASQTSEAAAQPQAKFSVANAEAPEFEISVAPQEWNPDEDSQPGKGK
jgi:hypothetical protein